MNDTESISGRFADEHGIDVTRIAPEEKSTIFWLETSWYELNLAVQQFAESLILDPTWGLLWSMLTKTRAHASASIALYVVGQPSSAEVVTRTVMEASVNVLYILASNRPDRLARYLSSYVVEQRDKCEKWRRTAEQCPEAHTSHFAGIAQKQKALQLFEQLLRQLLPEIGAGFIEDAVWPSVFERFQSVGNELGYRTEYTALCSQTHDAAEDLLNQVHIRSMGIPQLSDMLENETRLFSRMLIHAGIGYFLEACDRYAETFDQQSAIPIVRESRVKVAETAQCICDSIRKLVWESEFGARRRADD